MKVVTTDHSYNPRRHGSKHDWSNPAHSNPMTMWHTRFSWSHGVPASFFDVFDFISNTFQKTELNHQLVHATTSKRAWHVNDSASGSLQHVFFMFFFQKKGEPPKWLKRLQHVFFSKERGTCNVAKAAKPSYPAMSTTNLVRVVGRLNAFIVSLMKLTPPHTLTNRWSPPNIKHQSVLKTLGQLPMDSTPHEILEQVTCLSSCTSVNARPRWGNRDLAGDTLERRSWQGVPWWSNLKIKLSLILGLRLKLSKSVYLAIFHYKKMQKHQEVSEWQISVSKVQHQACTFHPVEASWHRESRRFSIPGFATWDSYLCGWWPIPRSNHPAFHRHFPK